MQNTPATYRALIWSDGSAPAAAPAEAGGRDCVEGCALAFCSEVAQVAMREVVALAVVLERHPQRHQRAAAVEIVKVCAFGWVGPP